MQEREGCRLCPRQCGADRRREKGYCGAGALPKVARAALHLWEEPCISGTRGSGTVFFSGCSLRCVFCQNRAISHGNYGKEVTVEQLAKIFLRLQTQGAHNLNLVTGQQYAPQIYEAWRMAKEQGLRMPVVWNTSGYETAQTVEYLAQFVDGWLADVKCASAALSGQFAGAPDYFEVAGSAVQQMAEKAGVPRYDEEGLLKKGLVVRLLVLPGQKEDAKEILRFLQRRMPPGGFLLSLMRQYTPPQGVALPGALARRLSSYEYRQVLQEAEALGFTDGYAQSAESADEAYTPPFDLSGVV